MTINKTQNGSTLVIALEGRLDTVTAPMLELEMMDILDGVTDLTLDLENLEYISSAGLRVLMSAYKRLYGKGKITVTNANDIVREVFEVTGFNAFLRVE